MAEHPAIRYARLGWQMLPAFGKAGIASHERATDSVRQIAWWIRQYGPEMNWQVVCGRRSEILVIDVENLQGHGELQELQRKHGPLPECPEVASGGLKGGYHLYFAYPKGRQIRSWLRLGTQVEVRGDNLLVNVPPSKTKRAYVWVRDPWTCPPPPAPEWLLEMMAPLPEPERKPFDPGAIRDVEAYVRTACEGEYETLRRAGKGSRNRTLYAGARALARFVADGRLDPGQARGVLMQGAEACGLTADPDDGPDRCMATIASAARTRGVRL